jgi:hypothetical protein
MLVPGANCRYRASFRGVKRLGSTMDIPTAKGRPSEAHDASDVSLCEEDHRGL